MYKILNIVYTNVCVKNLLISKIRVVCPQFYVANTNALQGKNNKEHFYMLLVV